MVTGQQIADGLGELGLAAGDIVLLHSALSSLGHVDGGARAVVDAFLDVIGSEGTLLVPAFGSLGAIAEAVKTDPRAVHSIHPRGGVAAIGAAAEALCRDHWKAETAHAEDTPYTRIAEQGGYVCLLGVDQDRNTTLHTAEELLRLPYLRTTAEFTFDTPEGQVTRSWRHFPGPHRDFIGLDRLLRDSGAMRVGRIGASVVRLVKSRDLIDLAVKAGRRDPAFVLCDNPNCADCVRQRADLRRGRFAREDFVLAAAASLAGRYVPEMIENLQAAGVNRVEFDQVQGQAVARMTAEKLHHVVRELAEAGIETSALRSDVISDRSLALIETAAECGVARVVLPLADDAADLLRAGSEHGVAVSLTNANMDSQRVSRMLLALRDQGLAPRFTFSTLGFVAAGEKPFGQSYKQKLRRFVDQVDLADATYDGRGQALACGHAEIKELVSILRCASFQGTFVLAAPNRHVGALADAAGRFERLLDTM